ncbi:neuraminidase-like domain-containing protein [Streptomyces canus]|uniref:Tc toxin subunit A-related protein n=1 Tax=Streptomyces canus TaxID=58343 RepID=UPI00368BE4C6
MMTVFAGFTAASESVIRSVGFGLAAAIALAFLVRMVIVPAARDLLKKRACSQGSPVRQRCVRGTVEDESGTPLDGVRVDVFDRDIGVKREWLGVQVSGASGDPGAFEVRYSVSEFASGEGEPERSTVAEIVFELIFEDRDRPDFTLVRLPEHDGEEFAKAGPVEPMEQRLGVQARDDEVLRIVLHGVEPPPGPSEYERLMTALRPLTDTLPLRDFDEGRTQAISFAAREIGVDRVLVDQLVTAHRLAALPLGQDFPPHVFYGLVRLLGVTDLRGLVAHPVTALGTALEQTVTDRLIPAVENPQGVGEDLQAAGARYRLDLPGTDTEALDHALRPVIPDAAKRMEIALQGVNHRGPADAFWRQLADQDSSLSVPRIQYAIQLANLSDENPELVTALRAAVPGADSMRTLALDLDDERLEKAIAASRALPTSRLDDGDDAPARLRIQSEIRWLLEASHPTSVVARLAGNWAAKAPDKVSPATARLLDRAVRKTDFELATDDVEALVSQQSAELFSNTADGQSRADAVDGLLRLQRLFRVSIGTRTAELLATGVTPGGRPYLGAADIAQYGKRTFLTSFGSSTTGHEETHLAMERVYDRARVVANTVATLMIAQYQDAYDAKPLWARNGSRAGAFRGTAGDAADAESEGSATSAGSWTDFFGSVETCECDECRSLTGPAAYFVALLQYLDKRCEPNADGITPADVLIGNAAKNRSGLRPDLPHIKLTCQNVNTTLPTIDLINQILESQVAFHQTLPLKTDADGNVVQPEELDPNEMSPGATDRVLAAGPEHLIQKAYDLLSSADYPMSLPFDRTLATARVYFAQAGTSRAEALKLFRSDVDDVVAAETLGLLRRDFEILTGRTLQGTAPAQDVSAAKLFGDTTPALPATARAVLTAFGLSFEELVALLRTRFAGGLVPDADDGSVAARLLINVDQLKALRAADYAVEPDSDTAAFLEAGGLSAEDVRDFVEGLGARFEATLVLDPPASCDPGILRIRKLDGGSILEETWLRLHRFVRLARRMRIGFDDLDVALDAVMDEPASSAFSPKTLRRLASLAALRTSLNLNWPTVASLVADIATHGPHSLYDRLFVDPGLTLSQPGFRRNEDGSVLPAKNPMLLEQGLAVLAAAYGYPPEDLAAAAVLLKIDHLTLATASTLYRVTLLATSLGVPPRDVVVLKQIRAGQNPEPDWQQHPELVAGFVEWARLMLGAGLSADLLTDLTSTLESPDGLTGTLREKLWRDLDQAHAAADERDTREKAEEVARQDGGSAFGDADLAAREQARSAYRDGLVAKILAPVCGSNSVAVAGLLVSLPALNILRHTIAPTDKNRANIEKLLTGIGRIERLRAAIGLPEAQFNAAVTREKHSSSQALEAILTAKKRSAVLAVTKDAALFADLSTRTLRPAALAAAILALCSDNIDWPAKAIAASADWLRVEEDLVAQTVHAGLPGLKGAEAREHPLRALSTLRHCLLTASRLGHTPSQIPQLLDEPIPQQQLNALIRGVASGFSASTWPEIARQLADPIRESSRDALVAYLLHRDGLQDSGKLFEELLVDTGISPFALTSPIRQAIFAIHTFVQRCQLGLVKDVDPAQINLDEWQVLQSKPLFTAQLETLLYPHWLLNPSWRDNKSVLFKAEEAALRQADATAAGTVQSFDRYLGGLTEVATLEVCGTFLQTEFEAPEKGRFTSVLHVVGRTRSSATRTYYYRRLNVGQHYREWTDWEPVDIDIQGVEQDRTEPRTPDADELVTPGVHLLPVVWRGQVYLFWPTFVRKSEGKGQPADVDVNHPTLKADLPRPYWDVKLSWTHREPAGWAPKQQSSALAETWWWQDINLGEIHFLPFFSPDPVLPGPNTLVLQAQVDQQGTLTVALCTREDDTSARRRFAFIFDSATSEVHVERASGWETGDHPQFTSPNGVLGCYQGVRLTGAVSAVADPAEHPAGDVLFTAQKPVTLVTLNQGFGDKLQAPLFMDLGDRAYFGATREGATGFWLYQPPPPASLLTSGNRRRLLEAAASAPLRGAGVPTNPWWTEKAAAMAAYARTQLQSIVMSNGERSAVLGTGGEAGFSAVLTGLDPPGVDVALPVFVPPMLQFGHKALDLVATPFSHPLAGEFQTLLRRKGIHALLSPETQQRTLSPSDTFASRCPPDPRRTTCPAKEGVDFAPDSPFGNTNWEIFFHLPDLIRQRLADNKQLDAAYDMQRTFFDPLGGSADPDDAWKFLPLREAAPVRLEDMLNKLSLPAGHPEREAMEAQIEAMREYPFQAHRIARLRPLAYKKWVVIEAIRLQLAISREFHARFPNPEAFNRAFQPCLLAKALLGPRPETVRQRASMAPRSYAELAPDLNSLGNVLLTAESKLAPLAAASGPVSEAAANSQAAGLVQRGAIGYFGIPPDRKLLALWDEVEDRLFKLRHSMTLDGEQIQLPLFPPRIDPAALAEAIGSGLSIDQVLDELGATRPPQRFQAACREAMADAQRLIAIGDALLAAEEQYDNETLAHTRAVQEQAMASMILSVREKQHAVASNEQLEAYAQRDEHLQEWNHFRELLRLDPSQDPSKVFFTVAGRKLDMVASDEISFEDLQVIPGLVSPVLTVAGAVTGGPAGAGVAHAAVAALDESVGGTTMAPGTILEEEKQELQESFKAVKLTFDSAALDTLAATVGLIPNFEGAIKPFGAGAAIHFGGPALAAVARASAGNKNTAAGMHRFLSQVYGKQASLVLREREWVAGLNRAAHGVREADLRIATAGLRIASQQAEFDAQEQALKNAAEIQALLENKFTSAELHDWRRQHLRDLFRRSCQVAMESFEAATGAYRWMREWSDFAALPRMSKPASAREELLFGHDLMTCLQELNRRFQASEQVGPQVIHRFSLREIDPWALQDLRETGEATINLQEVLFDVDHPEHYDRRIKGLQVSILCNRGPLVGTGGTLTLASSRRRRAPGQSPVEDPRLGTNSISLSTGQNDSGTFEVNPDLFQPFEGMGADCTLELSFPKHFRRFPPREISDVVLTLQVVAKTAGGQDAKDRADAIRDGLNALLTTAKASGKGIYRLISMRHDRTADWARFQAAGTVSSTVGVDDLSFFMRDTGKADAPKVTQVSAVRLPRGEPASEAPVDLNRSGTSDDWALPGADGRFPKDTTEDILLLAHFSL